MRSSVVTVLIVTCTVACTNGLPPDTAASMNSALDRLDREEASHFDGVLVAANADSVRVLENDHTNGEEALFRVIRAELERLSGCQARGGGALDTSVMHDAMQDAQAECDRHDVRMRTSSTLAEMQDEERRHRAAMLPDLDDLRSQEQRLLGTPDVNCP